jgi:hypothetical protein
MKGEMFKESFDKWDFLKLQLKLFKRGNNNSTVKSATKILELMKSSIDYRYQR